MELLNYPFGQGVRAFSTLRSSGGQGEGAYASFNITHYCGDAPENVATCRAELCEALGIADTQLFLPYQVHDNRVLTLDEAFLALPAAEQTAAMEGIDALVTAQTGICIGVSTADCIPLLLHDPTTGIVAAAHAGWRGVVNGVARHTIAAMQALGATPAHIIALIGPSIGPESFEVGEEVVAAFGEAGFPATIIDHSRPKAHIDLWAAAAWQLESLGLALENIRIAGVDTFTIHDSFFSARRLGVRSGRIFTGILRHA